jgi:hypothetical protein
MNLRFLCEKLGLKWGCTWVVRQDDSKVRWNTTKAGNVLEAGGVEEDAEPRTYLECIVCGKTVDEPSPEQVKELAG